MTVLAPSRAVRDSGPRSRVLQIDVVLLLAALTLAGIGALVVFAATRGDAGLTGGDPTAFLQRHLLNTAIGLVMGGLVASLDWPTLRTYAPLAYTASIAGLLVVLTPLGSTVNGSRSWISLPAGFSLQPAELAKVALVVALAAYLGDARERDLFQVGPRVETGPPDRRRVLGALLLAGVPIVLILAQPDLGTVIVLGATTLSLLVVAGLRARWLVALLVAGAGAVWLAVRLGVLRDYQLARFAAFADPDLDPLGVGYNTAQARIAIGSGGLWGHGLFEGPQTRGSFVPEQHTDFVFTVVGEELGFAGGALVIALFGVLLWRAIRIGAQAHDLSRRLVAAGIAGWFAFQAFQNIGMTLGLVPVTGLPLPFVSYGGSSMFASLLAVGLLQSVWRQDDGGARPQP